MLVESQYGNIDQITKQALLGFGNNLSIWFFHDNVLFTSRPRNLRWFVTRIRFSFCICIRPWFFMYNYSSLFFTELINYSLILILVFYAHSIDPHGVTNKTIWI